MTPVSETLLRCPLFAGISAEDLPGMLSCLGAKRARYPKGAVVMAEGSLPRDVGILTAGALQLVRTDYDGNRSIVMNISPGQLFAETFACAGAERLPVSVVAAESCEAVLLDCRRVLTSCCNACAFHHRIIFNLMQVMAEKNLALHRKALVTAGRTTREKLLTYLHMQAKEDGGAEFTIPFDRQGLADYLEVDRSGLSAEMSKLKKEGVLDYHRSRFHLLALPEKDAAGGCIPGQIRV